MWDVLYLAIMVALVLVAGVFVVACDKLIGKDEAALTEQERGEAEHPEDMRAAA